MEHSADNLGNQNVTAGAGSRVDVRNRLTQPFTATKRGASVLTPPGPDMSNPAKKATMQKKQVTLAETVAEAALSLAIVNLDGDNIIPISKEQHQLIFASINQMIFDSLDSDIMPTFQQPKMTRDVVKYTCGCSRSFKWLSDNAQRLRELTNLPLTICEFAKVPWPKTYTIFFPYTKETNERILLVLNKQNRDVPDIEWTVIQRDEVDNGVYLRVKAGSAAVKVIESKKDGFHFGAGIIHVREFVTARSTTANKPAAKKKSSETAIRPATLNPAVETESNATGIENQFKRLRTTPDLTEGAEQVELGFPRPSDLLVTLTAPHPEPNSSRKQSVVQMDTENPAMVKQAAPNEPTAGSSHSN